jgi:triacylglycerol lipase
MIPLGLDLRKANKFANMAQIAYMDDDAKSHYEELGYTNHKFLDIDGAQCHIVWNQQEMAICFRGTEPSELSDILADLNALPKKSMTDGWVHRGFRGELDKLWNDVKKYVQVNKEKTLYICGHSLGAAMATICTSRVEEFKHVEELYTYGSPRAGTASFVNGIRTTHWRFVNNNDIVTAVPLALMGYKHHGHLVYINHYGKIRKMTMWQRAKDQWRGRVSAWREKAPFDGARDHSMTNYVSYTQDEA